MTSEFAKMVEAYLQALDNAQLPVGLTVEYQNPDYTKITSDVVASCQGVVFNVPVPG